MKKVLLIFSFLLLGFCANAQDTLKLYKSGTVLKVEKESQYQTIYNPSQTTYIVNGNRVLLYDNVRGYSSILVDTLTTDSAGIFYGNIDDLTAYLENNISAAVNLQDSDGITNDENPFPINDIDGNNRQSLNTLFGDKITGIRKTSIAAQFQYGVEDGTAETELENGGSIVLENSLLKIISGSNVAGRARIQSVETVRYVPGQELYCFFTSVFDTAVDNSYQRVGLYDDANGFFVGYEDTVFTFTRRRDTVDYHQTIDLDVYNFINNYTFIPQRGNIYRISYGYLGFAPINLEVLKPNGSWALLSRIEYPNTSTLTHTTQTFLPIRGEVANTGNNTSLELRSGSLAAGIVDGGADDIAGRQFTWASDDVFSVSDSATIVTFRNKTTFNGIENRVTARLLYISTANNGNKTVRWRVLKNPNLKPSPTPVWVDVDTNNSTLEYSLNAEVYYYNSKDYFLAWNQGTISDFFEDVEKYVLDLTPGGTASFIIYTTGSGIEVDLSIRWSELF